MGGTWKNLPILYAREKMKILILDTIYTGEYGTFSSVREEGKPPILLALERPWLNNERGKSCIPRPAEYRCVKGFYENGGYPTFEIICPPREQVKFHKGNIFNDSHGCVLIGEMFEPILKDGVLNPYGIASSGQGFKQFWDLLKNESEFKLVIKEV